MASSATSSICLIAVNQPDAKTTVKPTHFGSVAVRSEGSALLLPRRRLGFPDEPRVSRLSCTYIVVLVQRDGTVRSRVREARGATR